MLVYFFSIHFPKKRETGWAYSGRVQSHFQCKHLKYDRNRSTKEKVSNPVDSSGFGPEY